MPEIQVTQGPIDRFEIIIQGPPSNEHWEPIAVVRATCIFLGLPEGIQDRQQLIIAVSDLPKLRDRLIEACEAFGVER